MKKLASALAVAALVGAPAIASAQGPVIYGQIHTSLEQQDNGDESGLNVITRSSRFGIRGGAPLEVGGLTAIYQIETLVNTAEGGGDLANRDTFVGVRGDFGTLRIGRMVPPSTVLRARTDFFADQIGDARNGLANQTAFDLRVGNSIAYGGSFGPIGVDLFYTTNLSGVATDSDQAMYGLGLNYSQGPLFVGLTYEHHNEAFTQTSFSGAPVPAHLQPLLGGQTTFGGTIAPYGDQTSIRLGASYRFGAFRVAGMVEHAEWNAIARSAEDVLAGLLGVELEDDTSISAGIGLSWTMDRLTLKGQYYMTQWDEAEDADHSMLALGIEYALAPTTTVHLNYAMTSNDDNVARTPYAAGATSNVLGGVAGEDASAFGVALIHRF